MTERIVVQQYLHAWKIYSRLRLTEGGPYFTPTSFGVAMKGALDKIPGIQHFSMDGYGLHVMPVHEALYPWADVEAAIVAEFAGADEVEIIRQDMRAPVLDVLRNGEPAGQDVDL